MRDHILGDLVIDHFPVFGLDGYSKITGFSNFAVTIRHNAVPVSIMSTIEEINSSGEYRLIFDPTDVGVWTAEINMIGLEAIREGSYNVILEPSEVQLNVAYDDISGALYLSIWLERSNDLVASAELQSCDIILRSPSGSDLAVLNSLTPDSDGLFRFVQEIALVGNRTYTIEASIEDSKGVVTTTHSFTTTGDA